MDFWHFDLIIRFQIYRDKMCHLPAAVRSQAQNSSSLPLTAAPEMKLCSKLSWIPPKNI